MTTLKLLKRTIMLTRHAIIIECSAISGQEKLPGAIRDADAWEKYLLSYKGGAWRNNEITVLHNPTPQIVKSTISRMPDGYGFVTFSGHGYVSASSKETMICLQGGNMSENELVPSSSRTTLILDSCRGVISESLESFAEARLSTMTKSMSDAERYRSIFDAALAKAEKGNCKLYGCSFDEASQESKAGGLFSQAMIHAGNNWGGTGAFTLRNAFDDAEKVVHQKSPQQTPESQLGRRLFHFPFAVKP